MKRFILAAVALTGLLIAIPTQAAVLNISQYNAKITKIHSVSYPKLWNDGHILSTYLYRYTVGNVVKERELKANLCGGYNACHQMFLFGLTNGNECKKFVDQCRSR